MDVAADQQDDDLWEFWERNEEFYDCVVAYYKAHPDVDIDVHEKEGAADSESEEDEA